MRPSETKSSTPANVVHAAHVLALAPEWAQPVVFSLAELRAPLPSSSPGALGEARRRIESEPKNLAALEQYCSVLGAMLDVNGDLPLGGGTGTHWVLGGTDVAVASLSAEYFLPLAHVAVAATTAVDLLTAADAVTVGRAVAARWQPTWERKLVDMSQLDDLDQRATLLRLRAIQAALPALPTAERVIEAALGLAQAYRDCARIAPSSRLARSLCALYAIYWDLVAVYQQWQLTAKRLAAATATLASSTTTMTTKAPSFTSLHRASGVLELLVREAAEVLRARPGGSDDKVTEAFRKVLLDGSAPTLGVLARQAIAETRRRAALRTEPPVSITSPGTEEGGKWVSVFAPPATPMDMGALLDIVASSSSHPPPGLVSRLVANGDAWIMRMGGQEAVRAYGSELVAGTKAVPAPSSSSSVSLAAVALQLPPSLPSDLTRREEALVLRAILVERSKWLRLMPRGVTGTMTTATTTSHDLAAVEDALVRSAQWLPLSGGNSSHESN